MILKKVVLHNYKQNAHRELDIEGNLIGVIGRNGVGKSAIIDALCYVLFGKVIRGISNQKLINKMSNKGQMVVWVEFTKDEWAYRVERTERPGKLLLLRKPIDSDEDFHAKVKRKLKFDIARGKTETTGQIVEILGFDINLFEYLVANSSESVEFFKLTEDKQRNVVEPLFGFTIMSTKAEILKDDYQIDSDIWSVTSFNELARDGQSVARHNRLHPEEEPRQSYVEMCLNNTEGPVIAATDYIKLYAEQIRAFVPNRYYVLGTDGYGRSDTREQLRKFFEVDRYNIVVATLDSLVEQELISPSEVVDAIARYDIDPEKPNPVSV